MMDFQVPAVAEKIGQLVARFAREQLEPRVREMEEKGDPLPELLEQMGQLGLLGLTVPREYGGAGLDEVAYVRMIEELSRVSPAHGVIASVHLSLVCKAIQKFGTAEQKEKLLPELATGTKIGAFALTEPHSGSDAAALKTQAVRANGKYRITGDKVFVTSAPFAGYILAFVKTDPEAGHKGITAILVPREAEGLRIARVEEKLGLHAAPTAHVVFEDCTVDEWYRLGAEGEGFRIAMTVLDYGRVGIAAQALGIAEAAMEHALAYAQEREAFGRKIADFQAIQWKLVEMKRDIELARLLIYQAAWKASQGERFTKEASMAKWFAGRTATRVTREAVQVFGGNGYSEEYPVARLFRDAKACDIYEGTTEIQHLIIARHLRRAFAEEGSASP